MKSDEFSREFKGLYRGLDESKSNLEKIRLDLERLLLDSDLRLEELQKRFPQAFAPPRNFSSPKKPEPPPEQENLSLLRGIQTTLSIICGILFYMAFLADRI